MSVARPAAPSLRVAMRLAITALLGLSPILRAPAQESQPALPGGPITTVALITLNPGQTPRDFDHFCRQVQPIVHRLGGEFVAVLDHQATMMGASSADVIEIIRWPSASAIQAMFEDPALQALQAERTRVVGSVTLMTATPLGNASGTE